jgi:hypothetical protein
MRENREFPCPTGDGERFEYNPRVCPRNPFQSPSRGPGV